MNVLGFRSFWDLLPIEWQMNKATEAIMEKIAEAGFDGIEFIPPQNPKDDAVFAKKLENLGLQFIGQVSTQDSNHAGSLREKTARLRDLNPVMIVSHSAKDSMAFDKQCAFNADFSHWMVACEGMPLEPYEVMKLAIPRTIHINGRVGYPEGPQVPDPRNSYYEPYVKQHLCSVAPKVVV